MTLHDQQDERVHPSNHTNHSYLSTPEKDERLHRLHTQIAHCMAKEKALEINRRMLIKVLIGT